ncbi:hypothetical protein KVT40_003252 [Elsinoe batatas]|uniref:Uncharacterized protein n=1 Tax=Elsinoe batatas TaxID=2601811 RepID=A0A8K0PIC1_9PEZI|nr:hypothetical protein KVT40_003252 [Elsinoe batatas]
MHFPKTSTFAIFLPLLLSHLAAAAPLEAQENGPVDELSGAFDKRDPLFGEGGVGAYAGINPVGSESGGRYDPNMKKRDPLFEEAGGVTGYAGFKPLAPEGKPYDPNMKKRDPLFEEAGGVTGYAGFKPLAPEGKPYDPNLKKRQEAPTKDVPGQFDGFGVELEGAALGVDKAWGNVKEAVTPDMNPNLVDHEGQYDGLSAEFAGLFDGQ